MRRTHRSPHRRIPSIGVLILARELRYCSGESFKPPLLNSAGLSKHIGDFATIEICNVEVRRAFPMISAGARPSCSHIRLSIGLPPTLAESKFHHDVRHLGETSNASI